MWSPYGGISYTQIEDFIGENSRDYVLGSDEEGNPMMKSHVTNYTMRPRELDELCLYDFLCLYTVAKRGQGSLLWCGDHPSKERLAVNKTSDEKRRIPSVNFLDFIDSKYFEGDDITNCTVPEVTEKSSSCYGRIFEESQCLVHSIQRRKSRSNVMFIVSFEIPEIYTRW